MMKKFFAVMALFGGLSLAAADPYFYSTVKHVDIGGEMLVYSNISVATKALNNIALKIGKAVGAENETVRCAINCALNLLDVTSFKAFAQSSVEVEPGFFVHKTFVNFDNRNSNSILSGKAFPDMNMDFLTLPADTRLAIVTNVNLGYIWKRVNDEIENNGDRVMTRWFADFKAEAMRNGVDIPKIAESINGPVTLLVTGESVKELKVMLIVTDKNGSIGAALRKSGLRPQDEGNIYHFDAIPFLPGSRDAQLRYEKGHVMFVSDPRIRAAGRTLGNLPLYRKYAQVLPRNGHSMILFDLSQKMIDDIRELLPYQARGFFNLKPVNIVFIEKNYPDGSGAVAASNFSVPMEIFNALERLADSIIEARIASRRRHEVSKYPRKYDRYESKTEYGPKEFSSAKIAYEPEHPEKGFREWKKAIVEGDVAAAKARTAKDSAIVVDMMIEAVSKDANVKKSFEGIEVVSCTKNGDTATLKAKSDGKDGEFNMVREDGKWKVSFK